MARPGDAHGTQTAAFGVQTQGILEPVLGWTTHHSILEYHGKWYLFYHDCELSNGINHRRNVKFTELNFDANGKIKTIFPYQ